MSSVIKAEQSRPGGELVRADAEVLSLDDQMALRRAVHELETSSLPMRLASALGRQIGVVGMIVPAQVSEAVDKAAEAAIGRAMRLALQSLKGRPVRDRRRMHKSVATLAGAAGGAFGLVGLPIELPFTTTVMLRSIADIAQSEGEDLSRPDAALACLEVFALGGETGAAGARQKGDALEAGYFAMRGFLAKSVTEAAGYLADRGLAREAAPIMVRLIAQISSRFGLVVSQKLATQSIPVLGGACGAAINYAFVDHFQTLARGHFTVRRLERLYGVRVVRAEYDRLTQQA